MPSPGQVLVTLLSRNGDGTASDAQIAAVEAALGAEVRPLTDEVIVASAEIIPYAIEARLTLLAGPDQSVVLVNAQAGLDAWIARGGRLGQDANRAAISAALFVEGVQNIELIEPAADVIVDRTQSANCVGISVTVAGVGD